MNSIKSHCITLLMRPLKILKIYFSGYFSFFSKFGLKLGGCILYTGAHYTRVNTVLQGTNFFALPSINNNVYVSSTRIFIGSPIAFILL